MKEAVVCVHGLFMNGLDMALLRHRIARSGYDVYQFRYPSRHRSARQNAAYLNDFVQQLPHDTVHFVCHSLGGLVIRHYFQNFQAQRPGRVLTMGTPHQGSAIAVALNRHRLGRWLLGKSVEDALLGHVPDWQADRDLGIVAGTRCIGVSWFVPVLKPPNDGTVEVRETQLPGAADRLILHVSHMIMLFSRQVAEQTCYFLEHGHFQHDELE